MCLSSNRQKHEKGGALAGRQVGDAHFCANRDGEVLIVAKHFVVWGPQQPLGGHVVLFCNGQQAVALCGCDVFVAEACECKQVLIPRKGAAASCLSGNRSLKPMVNAKH